MTVYTDEDFYDALLQLYGAPAYASFPNEEQLSYWAKRLPEPLLRYWREYGWGALSKGKYWLCNPDQLRPVLEEVFAGDPEFHADDLIPFGYNALGKIDAFMGQGRTMSIDLVFGTVIWRDQSIGFSGEKNTDFKTIYIVVSDRADYLDRTDENDIEIFPWALKNLGPLQPGEIYGFVPAYSVTGNYPVRNLQKVPLVEHLVMLASLSPPTLYDYVMPEDGEPGFGTLIPRRKVGPQP